MDASAIKAMMAEIAPVIREYVAGETAPLVERSAALELENVALNARIAELAEREPVRPEPVTIDLDDVRPFIEDKVLNSVSAAIANLPVPSDGKDCDMDAVKDYVLDVVAAIPKPKDGASCDMVEVERMLDGKLSAITLALPPGKDGPGFVDALIGDDGALVLTRTDGSTKTLPGVKGRDGLDGIGIAEWAEEDERIVVRHTDGSEVALPLPEIPNHCPDETCELVAKALRGIVEAPEIIVTQTPRPIEPAKQLPIVLNVNPGGMTQAPQTTTKTITTRRDGQGNLVADITERMEA